MSGLSFGFGNALDAASPDSDTSTEDVSGTGSSRSTLPFSAHSLPVQFVPFNGESLINLRKSCSLSDVYHWFSGIKCPVCSKTVLPDDIECHLVICLTKPRLNYNGKPRVFFFFSLAVSFSSTAFLRSAPSPTLFLSLNNRYSYFPWNRGCPARG